MAISVFAELRDKIAFHFNIGELQNLCFDLSIKYENLPGNTLDDKSRELVDYCVRHGRIENLIDRLKYLRSSVAWEIFEVNLLEPTGSPQLSPSQLISFSFLRQWKPNNMPNGFGADILLKSKLNKEGIISFIKFLTTDFITYADTRDSPILITLWSSKTAYEQNQSRDFGDEFRKGFLVFYVKNLTGQGAYNGYNEIRWMQKKGRFSDLFGTKTYLNEASPDEQLARVRLEPIIQPLRSHDKWVSIRVVNEGDDDITDCFGNLESYVYVWPDRAETDFNDSARLAWSSSYPSSSGGLIDIPRGTQAILDVARSIVDSGRLAFTLQRGDDPQIPGKYKIRVQIGGKFRGVSFAPLIFEGIVIYRGGTDITLSQDIP